MKQTIQSLKGTRDYYPEEMAVRNWLYENIRKVSESFGYQEWDGPFLETIELYAAKSGEELVKEQSFVFPDRGGDLITLRPELTPSLARMVAQRQKQLVYPLRWWSWGPFWRYERPQKGRTREFFQWNIDLIGVDTPEADAEMVAMAARFLKAVGLDPDQVKILVNNRRLMEEELQALDVRPEKRSEVFRLIDRRDKMPAAQWVELALTSACPRCRWMAWSHCWPTRSYGANQSACSLLCGSGGPGAERLCPLRPAHHPRPGLLHRHGLRRLGSRGEFRAILGGGRYDNLVSDVGGDPSLPLGLPWATW